MLLLVRASDGAGFSIFEDDLRTVTTLSQLRADIVSPLVDMPPDSMIIMNEQGVQPREEHLPALALRAGPRDNSALQRPVSTSTAHMNSASGSATSPRHYEHEPEARLYVYDRAMIEGDINEVATALAITEEQVLTEPPLGPEDPLSSHVALSEHNLGTLRALIDSLTLQRDAVELAINNLHHFVNSSRNALSLLHESYAPKLDLWTRLLAGWEGMMEAISRVALVDRLLTRTSRRERGVGSSSASEKGRRYLGDFVNRDKMAALRDTCDKVLSDLKSRLEENQQLLTGVFTDALSLQEQFNGTSLDDLQACEEDAVRVHERIGLVVEHFDSYSSAADDCYDELSVLDSELRDQIRFLVERKNAMSRYLVATLQGISGLQTSLSNVPPMLERLEQDFKLKTDDFKYFVRLEGLLPAYVATVVEVVRRREFARLLHTYAERVQSTATPVLSSEQEHREAYRYKHFGMLPWDIKGLSSDKERPALELAPKGVDADLPELDEDALEELRRTLGDLVAEADRSGSLAAPPLQVADRLVEALVQELTLLKADFEHLTAGDGSSPPSIMGTMEEQLREHVAARDALQRELQAEKSAREDDLARIETKTAALERLEAARADDQRGLADTRRELASLQRKYDDVVLQQSQSARERSVLELSRDESTREMANLRHRCDSLEESNRKSQSQVEELLRQLRTSQARIEELTRSNEHLESENAALRSAKADADFDLQQALEHKQTSDSRLQELETRYKEATFAASEKERTLRDYRGEAEMDKAVLEREMGELREALNTRDTQIESKNSTVRSLEDAIGQLKDQLSQAALKAEASEDRARAIMSTLDTREKDDVEKLHTAQEEAANANMMAKKAILAALKMRDQSDVILQAIATAQASRSRTGSGSEGNEQHRSSQPSTPRPATPRLGAAEISKDDFGQLLAKVEAFNLYDLGIKVREHVESLTTLAKRWKSDAKSYRDRAHKAEAAAQDKIAFRNFAKGDLALFLPTRNPSMQIWAAFNVSSPHHFLSPSSAVSEQTKSREWIIARITSLTESLVDAKEPSSNPYNLAAGTKYFNLEAEEWSTSRSKRAAKSRADRRSLSRSAALGASSAAGSSAVLVSDGADPADSRMQLSDIPEAAASEAQKTPPREGEDERPANAMSINGQGRDEPSASTSLAPPPQDPFTSPFVGSPSQPSLFAQRAESQRTGSSPPPTESSLEPTLTGIGAFPAFASTSRSGARQLPREQTTTAAFSKRYARPASRSTAGDGNTLGVGHPRPPRSHSSQSSSHRSVLSASISARNLGASLVGSPPKAAATTSTFLGDDEQWSEVGGSRRGASESHARPSVSAAPTRGDRQQLKEQRRHSSLFDSFGRSSSKPGESATATASDALKALKRS